jgi:hypothetical protein
MFSGVCGLSSCPGKENLFGVKRAKKWDFM